MATMTLLAIVQNILGSLTDDEVNDIGATEQSLLVAEAVKEAYFDIVSSRTWPWLKQRVNLTALGDTSNPTKMQFPTTVDEVFWIKYNKKDVQFVEPKDFQDMVDQRTVQANIVDANGFVINSDPLFWTTFDDNYLTFDGYDSSVESSLQSSKSVAYVQSIPSWTVSNTFVPQLPDKMFPMLLAEAKATCFVNLKQTANPREEHKAQRLRVRMASKARKNALQEDKSDSEVNYGRQTSGTFRTRMRGI